MNMLVHRMSGLFAALVAAGCSAPESNALSIPHHRDAGATSADPATPDASPSDAKAAPDAPSSSAPALVDEQAVLAAIANGAYGSSTAFIQVSTKYPSLAAPGSMIEEWVSASSRDTYDEISPDVAGSRAAVPRGTIIVRALHDTKGATTKLTVMCKGPAGYNPALGDWWFAVTTPDGAPLTTNGAVQTGKLNACFSCHEGRSSDDFLFGVPPSARSTHP